MDQATTVLEATKLAVGLAKDLSVQLLTLSSALIGLTVVFAKDIRRTHSGAELFLVILVLLAYIFSIACGIYAIMKLIGSLAPVGVPIVFSVDAARPAAGLQIIAFLVATFLFSLYGVIALIAFWWRGDQAVPAAAAPATVLPETPPPGTPLPGTAAPETSPPETNPPETVPPPAPTS